MNSNLSVSIVNNGLNWFQLQELSWGLFHYIILAYSVPVICVLGAIENFAIVVVISKVRSGIARTARLYYLSLAYFSIGYSLYMFVNTWSEFGLKFLTQRRFFFSIIETNVVVCKAERGFSIFFRKSNTFSVLLQYCPLSRKSCAY